MSSYKNVLLIGASGVLGAPVLAAFISSPYKVTVLSRQSSTATFPPNIPVIKADYESIPSLTAAMRDQDVVISMVTPEAMDQSKIIDAALAAGIKRFFPSDFGADNHNPELQKANPYAVPPKAAMVEKLREHESEMTWTAVVTGGFFDWAMRDRFAGFDIPNKTVTLIDDGVTVVTWSVLDTIGKALVAMLDHAEATKNRHVNIASFYASQRDILAAVERVDGQAWAVKHITSEEVNANGHRLLKNGDFSGIKDLTMAAVIGRKALGDLRAKGNWNERLGVPEDDMDHVLRELLKG